MIIKKKKIKRRKEGIKKKLFNRNLIGYLYTTQIHVD